jgi:hypothetical protein
MGTGLEPGIIADSRDLAARLGIGAEHVERRQRAVTFGAQDPDGVNGAQLAASAVAAELTRRGGR